MKIVLLVQFEDIRVSARNNLILTFIPLSV